MTASDGAGRNEAEYSRVRCAAVAGKAKGQLTYLNWPFAVIFWRNAFNEIASARHAAKAGAKLSAAFAGAFCDSSC